MKKVELVESVAEKAGLTKADATRAIDTFVETISETLAKGDKVPVAGFGTFDTVWRNEKTGRNPRNPKDIYIIPASNVPRFKPGKHLKEAVK